MPKEKIKPPGGATPRGATPRGAKGTKSAKSAKGEKTSAKSSKQGRLKFNLRAHTQSQASHRGMRVLFMGLLLLGMGQSLFFAVLPPVARNLGLDEQQTSIIFSLSALVWVFFSPFWGRKSDSWGRRAVMVIGLAGFAISTLLMTLVIYAGMEGWIAGALLLPLLIISRSLFGIFGSGTMPAAQAYMADRTTRSRRTQGASMLAASFGIGNIIGPGFAASLIVFGFLTPFFFIGVLGLGVAALVFFMVPERRRMNFRKTKTSKMGTFAKPLRVFIVLGTLVSYGQSVLIQLTAFYFIDRLMLSDEAGTQLVGIGFTFMALAALFAQFGIIQRFEPPIRSLLIYSAMILVVGYLGMGLAENYGSMVLSLGLCGLGFGLVRPGLMAAVSLSVGRQNQGAAAGAINATAAIGHVINPFTGAVIYVYYPSAPYLIVAGLMAVFAVVVAWHPRLRSLSTKNLELDEDFIPAPHVPIDGQSVLDATAEEPKAKPVKRAFKKKLAPAGKKPYSKKKLFALKNKGDKDKGKK